MQPGTISADGRWYWSGVRWEATLSADGRWRWAGTGWRPAEKDIAAVDPPAAGHKTVRGALALVLRLLGGPGTAFLRLTSGGWRWVLLARGRRQVAAPVVVGLAVLGAATTILAVTALAWFGSDNAGDRLGALAVGGFLLTLLVLPVVGLLGLAWGREF